MVSAMKARGFTLIELMVVMTIIAILLTLVAPRYFNHVDRAKEAALKQTLATTRDAIDKFHGDIGVYPETLDALVSRRYLRSLPVDPITDSSETWVLLPPPPAQGGGGIWDLHSGAEGEGADGKPYAQW